MGALILLLKQTGNWDWKVLLNLVSQRHSGGSSHRSIVKLRLLPQMKKYRCLWCVSTRNHNILYFVCIPRTILLNTGLSLWKAQKTLARRALEPSSFAPNLMQLWPFCVSPAPPLKTRFPNSAFPIPESSLVPPRTPGKTQKQCSSPARLCEVWRSGFI
jgi:hypothetical protein